MVEACLQQTQVELTKEVVSEVGRSKPAPSRKEATHGGERATERKRPREREREREMVRAKHRQRAAVKREGKEAHGGGENREQNREEERVGWWVRGRVRSEMTVRRRRISVDEVGWAKSPPKVGLGGAGRR